MMNWKVLGLLAIAVMMTALLIELKPASDQAEDRLLLPALADRLDQVSRVVITDGNNQVTLSPDAAGRWGVEEKSGYRVNASNLSRLLGELSSLEWREKKTARPENHERLGLAPGADTPPVKVLIKAGDTTMDLLVGASAEAGGSFVRFSDQDQVYLTTQTLDVPATASDWIDPVLINVDSSDVVLVDMQEGNLVARRNEAGDIELQDIPAGAELRYPTVADSLSRLLVNLRFEDVLPYNPQAFAGASETRIELESGEALTVSTIEIEGDYWLHIDRKELENWQYRVRDYTYNEFNKTLEDMLKPDDTA
ncbi:MAG: DUF4340 domain-containing protein [Proteobacteria bacterium]|nr:DUF4340 domain-containing protein [Pseudomonadota bacterium]